VVKDRGHAKIKCGQKRHLRFLKVVGSLGSKVMVRDNVPSEGSGLPARIN